MIPFFFTEMYRNEGEVSDMKRIKAACITQTVVFSNHDGETTEFAKKMIEQEYEKYKSQLEKRCNRMRVR